MAPLYQKVLIATILIIAFAGRIAVGAMPAQKPLKEIAKENTLKSDKPDADQSDEQLEEKIKLEDLMINGLTNVDFLSIACAKTKLFPGDYNLVKCCLQTLEYPPK